MTLTLGQVLQLIAAALAVALGVVVLRVGRRSAAPRALAILLFVEATSQVLWCIQRATQYGGLPHEWNPIATIVAMFTFSVQTVAYLALIRRLRTPFIAPLRNALVFGIATTAVLGPVLANAAFYLAARDSGDIANQAFVRRDYAGFAVAQLAIFIVGFISLAAAISTHRRAPPGSAERRQARAFVIAFAARDLLFSIALVTTFLLNARAPDQLPRADPLWPLGTLLCVPLLAYGILQARLFDIDLHIRWGIQKGTIVGVIVATAFVGEKLAEQILSREFGWVVGSILAGLLVFAAPRLNKLGDKVATTAMPKVEPTPAYVHFKKLEVYKAAVESALEDDGAIDERERAMLDRLRAKLGVSEADARAVEVEAGSPAPLAPPTDAAPS